MTEKRYKCNKAVIPIVLFFTFCIFHCSAFAATLQGGVAFDVKSARDYVQDGIPDGVRVEQAYVFSNSDAVKKKVCSYNNIGEVIATTVTYKNEPDKAYIYGRSNQLIYVDQYDRNIDEYPHRGYRYDTNGQLTLTSLTVSANEMFRFDPNGKLLAHSVYGVIYDEQGNVIGHRK